MAPSPRPQDDREAVRRSMNTQISIGSGTIPLAAIVGIAIGGALVLFAILVSIAVTYVRRKHRLETNRMSETKENGLEEMDLRTAIRSIRPPEISLSRTMPFNPFIPLDDGISSHDWASEDTPMAKARSHKKLFRMTGARDSWPLLSSIPLVLLPGHSPKTPCPVAPPGYVVEDRKWPKRSSSKLSVRENSISRDQERTDHRPTDSHVPVKMAQRKLHRRSISENQLSTILRSTSQRLKAAHRVSLTRTMSTLGRYPGSPPSERLPIPQGKQAAESREALVDKRFAKSVASSIYDPQLAQSSSLGKECLEKEFEPMTQCANSPTPSGDSRDSLCGTETPDLVIPASLTSPSRHSLRSERRHKMQLSLGNAKDISILIHNDSRPPLEAIGGKDPVKSKNGNTIHQRISSSSDPFYSAVKSSKPDTQIQGPRPPPPLYIRKATFGQEATTGRPKSFSSPLTDVSGNTQYFSRSSQIELDLRSPTRNPFQWSPQDAMQTRATQTSPINKRTASRGKGHKRSNVIRMSHLPRPPSTVDVVLEEPDEDSSLEFHSLQHPAIRRLEPTKNSSHSNSSTSGRFLSARPPSSAVFNPLMRIPVPATRSEDNSPTLGLEDIRNSAPYSPTLSVCNYFSESGGGSEDEFFSRRPKEQRDKSMIMARRHSRNCSADLSLFPTHQSQQEQHERLISFPLPSLSNSTTPVLTQPSSRSLPRIDFSMGVQLQSSATAAPPLLTVSIPSHLTGPRHQPVNPSISDQFPPRSVEASIGILRRMNSEVSQCSTSPPADRSSPVLPDRYSTPISSEDDFEERGRTRGSRHYLSVGNLAPNQEKSRHRIVGKRDSHRIYKERRKQRNEEIERDGDGDRELTPVKEVSSPATGTNALCITNLRFPTLSRDGTNGPTPPRGSDPRTMKVERANQTPSKDQRITSNEDESPRWSDAMTKPAHSAARRESKMEHPSPQAVLNWSLGLGPLGLAGKRLIGDGANKENEGKVGRPDSLGLYDQDGFLRSSPDREAARLEKERGGERRDAKRLSALVM